MTPPKNPPKTSRSRRSKSTPASAAETRPFVAHRMVPPHEVLSEEESAQVLATLGTPADRIPKILLTDPGLKTDPKYQRMRDAGEPMLGRVVRIRRPSATAGTAIAYRLIVDSLGAD